MRTIMFMVLLSWAVSASAIAAQAKRFTVSPDEHFAIKLDGNVVALSREPQTDPAAKVIPEKNGFTVLGDGIRKEFAIFDDRLEYTFDFALPAPSTQQFSILLPLPKGATATVTHGRTHPAPPPKVVLHGGASVKPPAELVYDEGGPAPPAIGPGAYFPLRYIIIRTDAYSLSVDNHPAGACSEDPSYAESPLRVFSCRQVPEGVEMVALIPAGYTRFPAHLKGKIIFYADDRPFEEIHPFAYASEYGDLERYIWLDFGGGLQKQKRKSGALPAGADAYQKERKYGWTTDTSALKLVATSLNAPVHGAFITSTSNQPAKFRIDTPPGYYALSLNFGNADGPAGPFRVKVNGAVRLERLQLDKGRFRNEALLVKTTEPWVELELEGIEGAAWLLNGLALEPLGTLNEDFAFTRPWWHFARRGQE